jgi:nitrogen fixation protein FixH
MIDNVVITLFGGLAAVLVLYALAGLVRGLPPLLRAIIAGGVPLIGYFVLILGHWPGLDVVAIHISVFFATALVLLALTQFRKRGGRMHWAPKLLMLFFAGLTVLMAAFLNIATNGLPEPIARWWLGSKGGPVFTAFSGVVSHGQGAATAISSELSESHREQLLGWQVELVGLDAPGPTRQIEARVKDRTGLPVDGVAAELTLQRPGAPAPALRLPLSPTDGGVYLGSLSFPASGRWVAELRLVRDGAVRYHSTQELMAP